MHLGAGLRHAYRPDLHSAETTETARYSGHRDDKWVGLAVVRLDCPARAALGSLLWSKRGFVHGPDGSLTWLWRQTGDRPTRGLGARRQWPRPWRRRGLSK